MDTDLISLEEMESIQQRAEQERAAEQEKEPMSTAEQEEGAGEQEEETPTEEQAEAEPVSTKPATITDEQLTALSAEEESKGGGVSLQSSKHTHAASSCSETKSTLPQGYAPENLSSSGG